MERLDIGQVYHGATDGKDRIFEYSVRFWNLFSRIQIRLWDWNDEAAVELTDLDSQPGPHHNIWDKLLTKPNRDRLSVNPEGVDTHGTATCRDVQAGLADHINEPNTITIDLEPEQGHRVVTMTIEFRLRSDGHKIMVETCSRRNDYGDGFGDDAARHALKKKIKEIEEREERVRAREASIRLGYMKLLDMTKEMERILELLND
ncbi:hypothetical protein DM02DRAFT_662753 [Periconia macrospinosa]|uniref:Uncharacterized protein n=1 Tax=Periconia macrospinosa TaxID=97972 RepID=A0A2V1D3L9_9PLEO|nr:hypothetical protein DM02DRAFT_662753 [Periconia macrospinosa]